jgi:hypothetical protein
VFAYFDNDVKVRAPFDAMALAHRLQLAAPRAATPDPRQRARGAAHALARLRAGREIRWAVPGTPRRPLSNVADRVRARTAFGNWNHG